jgi:NOL1/NOP2/fmu family ribosome biogenesis protein
LPIFVSKAERDEILSYYRERFGIPDKVFTGFSFLKEGKMIWVVSDSKGLEEILDRLKIMSAGVPLLRLLERWKPTTVGLQVFGGLATKNVVSLEDETLDLFLKDGAVHKNFPVEYGYVIVKWKNGVLGCGLYGKEGLKSQIPVEGWQQVKARNHDP